MQRVWLREGTGSKIPETPEPIASDSEDNRVMSSCVSRPNGVAIYGRGALNLLLVIIAAGCITASAQSSSAIHTHGDISNKGKSMEVVVIDSLVVPEESKEVFLQRVRQSAEILKKLPGFVEGYVYDKKSGEGDVNIVTTAVWKDQEALENAKKVIVAEFRKQGTNPAEIMKSLRVQASRSIYTRSPY
jgi:heme-degrading monooxygenase HmoA